MTPAEFIQAARVPRTLAPQFFGLWTIRRIFAINEAHARLIGGRYQTILYRYTLGTLHEPPGDVVMEDSALELSRHLPIWLNARGRVLITGLGLGCVVRGLLASPQVEHIDVVEIDREIIRVIGHEFLGNHRVTLHRGDALNFAPTSKYDFAWHDLWSEDGGLQFMHLELMSRLREYCHRQGAWAFPRMFKRFLPNYLG